MTLTWKLFSGIGLIVTVTAAISGCGTSSSSNNTGSAKTVAESGASVALQETGSSLLFPLFNAQWVPAYTKIAPNVKISSASTGSGTGISQALQGTVQIGASDAYLSNADMSQNPKVLNIPLAISAQQIMLHLPSFKSTFHLKLSGDVISKMYQGKIRYWDDKAIRALNPGVKLPHHAIVTVTRSDGSGDTFLFTQFLTATSKSWAKSGLMGTTVSFPAVQGGIGAKGNSGVVDVLARTPYSIGYVGISWLDAATAKGIGYAALLNRSGQFVLPTPQSIKAAASTGSKNVPTDERKSLIYQPGKDAYPIINFEYAIVNESQPSTLVKPLRNFLDWAISPSGGNQSKYLKPVHFLPLPTAIDKRSKAQIAKIGQSS